MFNADSTRPPPTPPAYAPAHDTTWNVGPWEINGRRSLSQNNPNIMAFIPMIRRLVSRIWEMVSA